MGWILVWTFLDTLVGFGFRTGRGSGWIDGVSPTAGSLGNGTAESPLADIFQILAGQVWVDWLFMVGLAVIGGALIIGVMTRFAGVVGAAGWMIAYLALLPLAHDPFMSYHLVYILVLLLIAATPSGEWFGLGRWWSRTRIARTLPFLK